MQLPDARTLSLQQLYAIYSQGDLHKASVGELARQGWLDLIGRGILGLTATGSLVWLPDSSGRAPVVEQNSSSIKNVALDAAYRGDIYVGTVVAGSAYQQHQHRAGRAEAVLVGGSLADVQLVPATASYYGVVRIRSIVSDTPGTYSLAVHDAVPNDADGGIEGRIDATVTTAYVPAEIAPGVVMSTAEDNSALQVDIGGGAAAEKVTVLYDYWLET